MVVVGGCCVLVVVVFVGVVVELKLRRSCYSTILAIVVLLRNTIIVADLQTQRNQLTLFLSPCFLLLPFPHLPNRKTSKLNTVLGTDWVQQVAKSRARSERWSNTLILMFLMHAPVSQRLFYYFACTDVGQTSYLVQDYSIECSSPMYNIFAPYVVFMLVVFTLGLPLLVSGLLFFNRKALYNPKVHATMGFLYARFHKGSEFWEMHEVVRKCSLMGLLIFLPPTARSTVGILICVVCCCTLNYFQPHRNTLVLFVSQMSFLMSTFKYVCAVFLRLNTLVDEDQTIMGWIIVMFDVVFMAASIVAFVLMIVLLRANAHALHEDEQDSAEPHDDVLEVAMRFQQNVRDARRQKVALKGTRHRDKMATVAEAKRIVESASVHANHKRVVLEQEREKSLKRLNSRLAKRKSRVHVVPMVAVGRGNWKAHKKKVQLVMEMRRMVGVQRKKKEEGGGESL